MAARLIGVEAVAVFPIVIFLLPDLARPLDGAGPDLVECPRSDYDG